MTRSYPYRNRTWESKPFKIKNEINKRFFLHFILLFLYVPFLFGIQIEAKYCRETYYGPSPCTTCSGVSPGPDITRVRAIPVIDLKWYLCTYITTGIYIPVAPVPEVPSSPDLPYCSCGDLSHSVDLGSTL